MEDYGIKFNDEAAKYKDEFLDAFCDMVDPELGVDFANLGLIYAVDLTPDGECSVDMGVTTIGCPLVDELVNIVGEGLLDMDVIQSVNVDVDYTHQWTMDRITRYGKMALGLM